MPALTVLENEPNAVPRLSAAPLLRLLDTLVAMEETYYTGGTLQNSLFCCLYLHQRATAALAEREHAETATASAAAAGAATAPECSAPGAPPFPSPLRPLIECPVLRVYVAALLRTVSAATDSVRRADIYRQDEMFVVEHKLDLASDVALSDVVVALTAVEKALVAKAKGMASTDEAKKGAAPLVPVVASLDPAVPSEIAVEAAAAVAALFAAAATGSDDVATLAAALASRIRYRRAVLQARCLLNKPLATGLTPALALLRVALAAADAILTPSPSPSQCLAPVEVFASEAQSATASTASFNSSSAAAAGAASSPSSSSSSSSAAAAAWAGSNGQRTPAELGSAEIKAYIDGTSGCRTSLVTALSGEHSPRKIDWMAPKPAMQHQAKDLAALLRVLDLLDRAPRAASTKAPAEGHLARPVSDAALAQITQAVQAIAAAIGAFSASFASAAAKPAIAAAATAAYAAATPEGIALMYRRTLGLEDEDGSLAEAKLAGPGGKVGRVSIYLSSCYAHNLC